MIFTKKCIKVAAIAALLFANIITAPFALAAPASTDDLVPDSTLTIETASSTDALAPTSTPTRELIREPNIRVGLYKTTEAVWVMSPAPYSVYAGSDLLGTLAANDSLNVRYNSGVYHINSVSIDTTTTNPLRLIPDNPDSFFIVTSYKRKVAGRGVNNNFNAYRGTFEYRYSPKSKMPYIINELPLDEYVRGIAESANDVPTEYAKALLVAARSYAYTHIRPGGPTDNWLFDVYATTQDQLYLGYMSEVTMPRIAQAAIDTNGEMVTYNGAPVVTPYFSHSNGKTLGWKSKDRPWLVSVKAPYDKKRFAKMLGHGYGMSNYDASMHAGTDGWTYDQILLYYYSGTKVEKIY